MVPSTNPPVVIPPVDSVSDPGMTTPSRRARGAAVVGSPSGPYVTGPGDGEPGLVKGAAVPAGDDRVEFTGSSRRSWQAVRVERAPGVRPSRVRHPRLLVLLAGILLAAACSSGGDDPTAGGSGATVPSTTSTGPTNGTGATTTALVSGGPSGGVWLEADPLWIPTNPGGGGAYSSVAANGEGMIMAGSDLSGVTLSRDRGESWETVGPDRGIDTTHISAVAFDRRDPEIAYAGADGGLFRSTDAGATFQRILPDGYVSAVAADHGTVYAGWEPAHDSPEGRVLRSEDGGDTWSPTADLPPGRFIRKLQIDRVVTDRLVVLTGDGRFTSGPAEAYLSENGGDSWRRLGPEAGPVTDVFLDHNSDTVWMTTADPANPDDPGRLLASFGGGDFRDWYPMGGVIWAPIDQTGTLRLVQPEAQFPWDDRRGVWESTDGGGRFERVGDVTDWSTGWTHAYWAYLGGFDGPVPSLGFDPVDGDRAYLVNSQWIFGTDDGGHNFGPLFTDQVSPGHWASRGFDNVVVADVAQSPADPDLIYAGYWDLGCFRSEDGGGSWQNCNVPELTGDWEGSGGFTGTILPDPERPDVVWAAMGPDWESPGVLVRSEGRGATETWQPVRGLPTAPAILGLALDPTSPTDDRTLFATVDGDVFTSSNDGRTWSPALACGGCRTTHVATDGTAYAGGEAGLWVLDGNGGGRRLDSPGPLGPNGFGGEVSGPPWEFDWAGVVDIETDVDGRIWVVVLGTDGGVFTSDDGGSTWDQVRQGPYFRDLALDPKHPDLVLLASSSAYDSGGYDPLSGGLEISRDGGRTWAAANSGLPWPFVTTLDLVGDHLALGSPGTGVNIAVPDLP